jgi:hypothetical protein
MHWFKQLAKNMPLEEPIGPPGTLETKERHLEKRSSTRV